MQNKKICGSVRNEVGLVLSLLIQSQWQDFINDIAFGTLHISNCNLQ